MERNNTSYQSYILSVLKSILREYMEKKDPDAGILKYYQFVVNKFFLQLPPGQKGLLIYHSMGTGKTYLAISVALMLSRHYEPIFIAPKSLHSNFQNSLIAYGKLTGRKVDKISLVTYNSYNLIGSLTKTRTNLENTLIIVDEAHNFFRGIINNPESQAGKLYHAIMNTKNIRLLFLTGTLPAKNPFELVPCFNMISGQKLFEESYIDFTSSFIGENGELKNKGILSNRIIGLTSYADITLLNKEASIPDLLPSIIVKTKMSKLQYQLYLIARDKEIQELSGVESRQTISTLMLPKSSASSTYYVESRTISTYYGKEYAKDNSPKIWEMVNIIDNSPGPVIIYSQFIKSGLFPTCKFLEARGYKPYNALPHKNVGKKEKFERAMLATYRHQTTTRPHFGVNRISWALEYVFKVEDDDDRIIVVHDDGVDIPIEGFKKLRDAVKNNHTTVEVEYAMPRRFAVISGDIPVETRDAIKDLWNSKDNIYGDKLFVLLISETGIEGLDLKYGRQAHILTYPWNKSKVDQFVSRIARIGSHSLLPESARNVQAYIHLATHNDEVKKNEEHTIDEQFYDRALKQGKINSSFSQVLRDTSLECKIYGFKTCYTCKPTGKKLYKSTVKNDISFANPCEENVEMEYDLQKIKFNGKTYYYSYNPNEIIKFEIFTYDEELELYTVVNSSNPDFQKVYRHLLTNKK